MGDVFAALEQMRESVDMLLAHDFTIDSDSAEVLEFVREFETLRRRMSGVDHRAIIGLETHNVAGDCNLRNTAVLLSEVLRIAPTDASARLTAAHDLGPRRALTGERLEPCYPLLAAAQRDGQISPRHAAVAIGLIKRLPAAVRAEKGDAVEAVMRDASLDYHPTHCADLARGIREALDPDGTLSDDKDHHDRRELRWRLNPDGSADLTGHLTPSCAAVWQAIWDSLARPNPSADGEPDRRTPAQRRHDAYE